jgi:hypothetical protein
VAGTIACGTDEEKRHEIPLPPERLHYRSFVRKHQIEIPLTPLRFLPFVPSLGGRGQRGEGNKKH